MANAKKLTTPLTDREKTLGLVYTVLALFVLPTLLTALNAGLPRPLHSTWVNFLYFCLNFGVLCWLLRSFLKKSLSYAGKHILPVLVYSVIGFLLYYVSSYCLSFLLRWLMPGFFNINDLSISIQFSGNFWMMAIGTVILVPLAEELMHRALIFGILCRSSVTTAYTVSVLCFAAIHVLPYIGIYAPVTILLSFVQYLPAGLILAWSYRSSGCIFVPVLIHTAVNTVGILSLR